MQTMFDSKADRKRVHERIGALVLDFVQSHATFHMAELTAYVNSREVCAPDSAGRILRMLRKQGALDYRVVSRSESLYERVGA